MEQREGEREEGKDRQEQEGRGRGTDRPGRGWGIVRGELPLSSFPQFMIDFESSPNHLVITKVWLEFWPVVLCYVLLSFWFRSLMPLLNQHSHQSGPEIELKAGLHIWEEWTDSIKKCIVNSSEIKQCFRSPGVLIWLTFIFIFYFFRKRIVFWMPYAFGRFYTQLTSVSVFLCGLKWFKCLEFLVTFLSKCPSRAHSKYL